jgi:OHCU decarboxylase
MLQELNVLPAPDFVVTLASIFEHSPWVAERVADQRPFTSESQLLDAMRAAVDAASIQEQMALIKAHPKLGMRGATRQGLTELSKGEQRRAGLDACTPEQLHQLQRLNGEYEGKFSFPFILAVRGHDAGSIIANLQSRLAHDRTKEIQAALVQIGLIAGYRLNDLLASPSVLARMSPQ